MNKPIFIQDTVPMDETEIVTGNYFNKYETNNPVARWLVGGFMKTLSELLGKSEFDSIHEIGCGEGFLAQAYANLASDIRASDLSSDCISKARLRAKQQGLNIDYQVASIYDLDPQTDSADLVVCCEVMEHLEYPDRALEVLASLANKHLICSVPREPLWRILNVARGKYWSCLGNTPGHLQHWSTESFKKLIGQEFEIIEVRNPLPWTFLYCKKKA